MLQKEEILYKRFLFDLKNLKYKFLSFYEGNFSL